MKRQPPATIRCKRCDFVAKGANARSKFTRHQNLKHRQYPVEHKLVVTKKPFESAKIVSKRPPTQALAGYDEGYATGYRDALRMGDRRQQS